MHALVATVFALGMVFGDAKVALAHEVAYGNWTYVSSENCTWAYAWTNHGSYGTGYHQANSSARFHDYNNGTNCGVNWNRPAGELAVRFVSQKQNGSSWSNCHDTGYYYNGAQATELSLWATNEPEGPPCGDGTYRTVGYAYVHRNGVWYGGSIWTGGHQFEGSSGGGK